MTHPTHRQLYEFLDGSLGPNRHRAVAAHLALCAGCRREIERARGIELAARRIEATTSPGFTDAVMGRILAEAPRPAPTTSEVRAGARRFMVPGLLVAMYLTVALLVGLGTFGDDGSGGRGWTSDAVAWLARYLAHVGDVFEKMSGGISGVLVVAVAAMAGLIVIDGVIGRRLPRGRH